MDAQANGLTSFGKFTPPVPTTNSPKYVIIYRLGCPGVSSLLRKNLKENAAASPVPRRRSTGLAAPEQFWEPPSPDYNYCSVYEYITVLLFAIMIIFLLFVRIIPG